MITSALLEKVAWLNVEYVKGPISGIAVRFPGLGSTGLRSDPDMTELEWGQAGIVTIYPYQDPWGWMNKRTLHFIDDLVDAVRKHHGIGTDVPLISTGVSMGGHATLLYTIKSRQRIAACMALYPVCDLPFHYTERTDLPRTMHHAYDCYENLDAKLKEHSPLHLVQDMPDIPYLFVHGEKDLAVKKSAHSDPMVAAMRKRQLRVEYVECPKMGHGNPIDYATSRRIVDFVIAQRKV